LKLVAEKKKAVMMCI